MPKGFKFPPVFFFFPMDSHGFPMDSLLCPSISGHRTQWSSLWCRSCNNLRQPKSRHDKTCDDMWYVMYFSLFGIQERFIQEAFCFRWQFEKHLSEWLCGLRLKFLVFVVVICMFNHQHLFSTLRVRSALVWCSVLWKRLVGGGAIGWFAEWCRGSFHSLRWATAPRHMKCRSLMALEMCERAGWWMRVHWNQSVLFRSQTFFSWQIYMRLFSCYPVCCKAAHNAGVDGCHCFLVKVTSVPFASEPFGLFLGGNQFRMSSLAQRRQVAYLYPSKLIIQFRGQQMRWTNPMIESKHSNNINK